MAYTHSRKMLFKINALRIKIASPGSATVLTKKMFVNEVHINRDLSHIFPFNHSKSEPQVAMIKRELDVRGQGSNSLGIGGKSSESTTTWFDDDPSMGDRNRINALVAKRSEDLHFFETEQDLFQNIFSNKHKDSE
ncbi:hypothetical protein WN51_11258 [Melipona quadrifasciata]|uniref:Uncharacterized protein n=1 Tax=Melipona quadrifasciata TaxID=166423 RepID=A0A0N0U614_9HYME|nr:hypothetical protein WN51_11258 [Melipona quadrifasciata]